MMATANGITYVRFPVHLLGLRLRSAHEVAILGLAVGFNGKGIRMSNAELARLLRMDRRHVPRLIGRMADRGYLRVEMQSGRRIIHPTDTILASLPDTKVESPPDTKVVTKGHQSGDKVTPEVPCPSISERTKRELKGARCASGSRPPKTTTAKAGRVAAIVERWNSYSGRSVEKPDSYTGGTVSVRWHGCRLGTDGAIRADVHTAIQQALKKFSPDDIKATVDNYAEALLNPESFWTHSWSITEFFTRREGRAKGDGFKWWRFLPGTFAVEKYRRKAQRQTGSDLADCQPCDEDEGFRIYQEAGLLEANAQ